MNTTYTAPDTSSARPAARGAGPRPGPTVRRAGVALALVTLLAGTAALEAQTPSPRQARPVALTGGTIHTVADGVIERGTIIFENGRITALGTDVAVPANAERVDVSGRHIYPGLIDGWNQMGLFEIGGFDVTIDQNELGDFNPNARAHVAFNPESRHIGTTRSNGVLVTVSSPSGGLISGLAGAMMLDGWTWEQMTLRPETGLIVNWPSAQASGRGQWQLLLQQQQQTASAQTPEQRYDAQIRELRDYFATARAYRTARAASPDRHPTDARLEAMIPVLERRTPVIVRADDLRQIQDAVMWAEQENLRLVLLGGRDAGYVADLLARRNVPVLVTNVLVSPSRAWEAYDSEYSLPAQLHRAGVRFAITGGSSAPYANRLPYEAGAAIAYGLPAAEALRAVTLYPAQFLGLDDRVGSLEVGKDATLLITTGSPLEYATIVEQAYIEGRRIDMIDAHRNFFEKYAEKQRQLAPPVVF